jgi:hypothetical protein
VRDDGEQATGDLRSAGERALDGLLTAMHLAGMEEMPALVAEHARLEGFSDLAIYVTDLQHLLLVPLPGQQDASGGPLPTIKIDGTLPGRAFQSVSLVRSRVGDDGPYRMWTPLLDGAERIGTLGLTAPHDGEPVEERVKALASLVALLVVSKRPHSDSCARLVRAHPLTLSAEVLWNLLPPGTFANDDVVVSATLEPAYAMGGDTYDYAIDGHTLHLSIYDSMGHDTSAGLTATLAMGASRNHRRQGRSLAETAQAVDEAIGGEFEGRFATGILAALDLRTGVLTWVNRGHHPPLVLRGGRLVATLSSTPDPPMGLGLGGTTGELRFQLEPGDRLLLYTDGIIEAKSPDGEEFGLDRFIDFVVKREADGLAAPETLRRLIQAILAHQGGRLQDDATVMTLEWKPSRHRYRLVP